MASPDETSRPPPSPTPAPPRPNPAESTGPARPVSRPPRPRDRITAWLGLLACLALALPALLIELHRPDVVDRGETEVVEATRHEATALLTSVETLEHWRRSGDLSFQSLAPHRNGRVMWDLYPGVTWAQGLAMSVGQPTTDIGTLTLRARLLSAGMVLLTVASVYWAGFSVGGARTAAFAGLVCASNPVFLFLGRLGSPSVFYAAWSVLGIAAALWALRPLKPSPSIVRQAVGWAICGVAMGMAMLSAGPGALLGVALIVVTLTLLVPGRAGHLLGLVASLLIAGLVVLPWAAYAHQMDANAWPLEWEKWVPINWLNGPRLVEAIGERFALLALALLPWTFWLIGAVVQPFSTSSAGVRTRLFLGWSWFALTTLFLLLVDSTGRQACLMAALAAAAVLIAEIFNQYVEMAAAGRFAKGWRVLRWPHMLMLALASVGAMMLLSSRFRPDEWDPLQHKLLHSPGWAYALGLCLVLLGLVGLSVRYALRDFPGKALALWALWGGVFAAAMMLPVARGPLGRSPVRAEAQLVREAVGDRPIYWWGGPMTQPAQDHASLLLYVARPAPVLTTERFEEARLEHGRYFLLGPVNASAPEGIVALRVLPATGATLWECVGPVRPPSTAPAAAESPETAPAATTPASGSDVPGSTAPTTQEN